MLKINNKSEFSGLPLDQQLSLIDKGKKILENEGCWQPFFMAPYHSFDENTLAALTSLGFKSITDGYGIFPYKVSDIILVPQLFSRPVEFLPGIQTLCIHINSMHEHEILKLESFVLNNRTKFLNYIELSKSWQNFDKAVSLRYLTEFTARTLRYLKSL
jgi:predicted deacetylase